MPNEDITTLAEFKSYLSEVRRKAGQKGGSTPTTKRKGFAAVSKERLAQVVANRIASVRKRKLAPPPL